MQYLQAIKNGQTLPHAWIFSGPDKIGKKTVALEWASEILGFSAGEKTAHPDFLFVAPLADEKTGKSAGEIAVAQIRELIVKMALAPTGKHKIVIVDSAHLMNAEAQNCLLKTLEEPPAGSLIILIAENDRRLLETVRSRCQTLRFNFLPENEMETLAEKLAAETGFQIAGGKIKEIAEISFGRPGRLAGFLKNPEELEKWRAAEKEFVRAAAGDLAQKFAYAKKITDAENSEMNLNEILEIWQYRFRNLLLELLKTAPEPGSKRVGPFLEQKGSDPFREKTNGHSPEKIVAILKKIQDLYLTLQTTNANPRLSVENFLLEL